MCVANTFKLTAVCYRYAHTWCFCLFFLSASSFCCFSSFSVALASRSPWRFVRLYAFTFIAVSRDVSLRVQDKICEKILSIKVHYSTLDTALQTKWDEQDSPHFWAASGNSELWELWALSELAHEDLLVWWWAGYLAVQCAEQYELQLWNTGQG